MKAKVALIICQTQIACNNFARTKLHYDVLIDVWRITRQDHSHPCHFGTLTVYMYIEIRVL